MQHHLELNMRKRCRSGRRRAKDTHGCSMKQRLPQPRSANHAPQLGSSIEGEMGDRTRTRSTHHRPQSKRNSFGSCLIVASHDLLTSISTSPSLDSVRVCAHVEGLWTTRAPCTGELFQDSEYTEVGAGRSIFR